MPHPRPLDALRDRLRVALDSHRASHALEWGNPRVMSEALKNIKMDLGGDGSRAPSVDVLQSSLQSFAQSATVATFTELKYVCYGVTVPVGPDRWRVIDRPSLFDALLNLVKEREPQTKQFRRCFQGLLSGYFGFEHDRDSPDIPGKHWVRLRGYLADRLDPLLRASTHRGGAPDWLNTLAEHRNLLTTNACSRYAASLYRDDTSELRTICSGLGITGNSWVWDEALMAYVRMVCEDKDQGFHRRLSSLLNLVNGRSDLKLPITLATKATAQTVIRYSNCADKPEHPDLRDTCVHWIGNPWLRRTAWDASVNHEPARLMVNSWLKQRLIKDFFELLAADGAADLRRLNYWLKWEPQITDMWFVLGTEANSNQSPEFAELRKRMAGRDRVLQDHNSLNNAFVMRIGPLLVIEFGVTGNACYIFAAAEFMTSLEKKMLRVTELKQRAYATRLSHVSSWEPRFDYELRRLLQSVPQSKGELIASVQPASKPSPSVSYAARSAWPEAPARTVPTIGPRAAEEPRPRDGNASLTHQTSRPAVAGNRLSDLEFEQLKRVFARYEVEWEDNRSKGGALWVLIPDGTVKPHVIPVLQLYGFRHFEGKGYWLKDRE